MSVIGRVGLVPNAYKGTLKYYVNWETRGSRSAKLACKFEVLSLEKLGLAHSAQVEVVEAYAAYSMPLTTSPETEFDQVSYKFLHSNYQEKLQEEFALSFLTVLWHFGRSRQHRL
jgi:hypothetical protein